jgi:hypothetical protein
MSLFEFHINEAPNNFLSLFQRFKWGCETLLLWLENFWFIERQKFYQFAKEINTIHWPYVVDAGMNVT